MEYLTKVIFKKEGMMMKKYFKLIIAVASSAALFAACAKEDNAVSDTPEIKDNTAVPATIIVAIPEEGLTKVALEQDSNPDGVVKLTWESSDFITIKNAADESNSVNFTYASGAGTATATFSAADVSALDGASSYNIYLTSKMPGGFAEQTQASNGSTAHLGYAATLSGVNKYDGATFSQTWATENGGGTLESSSVLRIRAQMPTAEIADAVQKVIIKASANIFAGSDQLAVSITTPGVDGDGKVVTVYATLPAGNVDIAADTELLFQFQVSGNAYDKYTAYRKLAATTLYGGQVNAFKLNCSNINKYANASDVGIGGSSNHILIGDQHQMSWLASKIVSGNYIDLVDDIDMTGEASSLNPSGAVTFNGNGKTISNTTAPLFDDLKGAVSNFTISNAVITSAGTVGILAKTCNNVASAVSGVTVTGDAPSGEPLVYHSTLTSTATEARKNVGGLVGEVSTASTFDDCHVVNTSVTAPNGDYTYPGCAFGYVHNADAKIGYTIGCTVTNSVISGHNYTSGFIGYLDGGTVNNNTVSCVVTGRATTSTFISRIEAGTLTDNSVSGSISGVQTIGGLAGYVKTGSLIGNSSSVAITGSSYYLGGLVGQLKAGTVDNCHASGNITQTGGSNHAHTGGLIGTMDGGTVQNGCYYSTGTIDSQGQETGGLIGDMTGGTVNGCHASGSITTTQQKAGGLIGILTNGTVQNCYATASITTSAYYAAGLIGEYAPSDGNSHTLESCHATGTINTGSHFAGGLVGHLNNNVQIKKCYSTVDILPTATNMANHGGIVSHTESAATLNIENCYYTGAMGTDTYKTRRWCGGILGQTASGSTITVSKCYASFTIKSANIGLEGALVGKNESTSLTCTSFVGWSSLSKLYGQYNTVSTDGNYLGQEGTIYSQAAAFVAPNNWDFVNVWTTDATPLLR